MLYFEKWKTVLIILVCLTGVIYAAPNFLPGAGMTGLPGWAPGKQVNLGLDLQGGSHLLLQADLLTPVAERHETTKTAVRAALREARIRYRGLKAVAGGVEVEIIDPAAQDQAREALRRLDPDYAIAAQQAKLILSFTDTARAAYLTNLIGQSIEVVRRRVDELGTTEPLIQRQGDSRIVVQVPGFDDPEQLKAIIGRTAKMSFHLVHNSTTAAEARSGRVPAGYRIVPASAAEADTFGETAYLLQRRVMVSGDALVDSQPDLQDGQVVVSFRFDAAGGAKFGNATARNVGQRMAIVLDNEVISAPRIQSPILGGAGIITGSFTFQSASDLALLLRAGALPTELTVLEERTVGPGLGQDSIDAGRIASIVGLIGVVVFMVAAYGLFGLFANIALLFNLTLVLGVLSLLQATLTLPGIAGIVLTVGMAVDANVLIFERIREERRQGRSVINAVDAGYRRALTTIVDANITTLIAAIVLFIFGTGPVKGFAVTLSIGIVTSMFTAIMVTRLQVAEWVRRRKPAELPM